MKIIALSEGAFTVDKTKRFIPFDLSKDQLDKRTTGSLLVEIQPFVVITKKDIVLLDTGLGFTDKYGNLQIFETLIKNGIDPESVSKILLSHLHRDHSGGLINKSGDNYKPSLAFKNATYYINSRELNDTSVILSTSYIREDILILQNSVQVKPLGDSGVIDNYIYYEISGGHSPFHQIFWIKEDNEIIFYGGDVAPQLQQMKNRFVAKYDFDGKKSMELRHIWMQRGKEENWTFLFYHDLKNPIFSFNQ